MFYNYVNKKRPYPCGNDREFKKNPLVKLTENLIK